MRVHIFAAVAEHEAKMISERIKAALAAAKGRGTKMGGGRGDRPSAPPSSEDVAQGDDCAAAEGGPCGLRGAARVQGLQTSGVVSLNALAKRLNELGDQTPRKGVWTATAVKRVWARVV